MRYTLDSDNKPVEVTSVVKDGMRIVHPSDELVDELEAGYQLVKTRAPEYDSTTQSASFVYGIKGKKIVRNWTVTDLPQMTDSQKRIQEINSLIATSNQEFATYKDTPITYSVNGLKYKPSYLADYWSPLIVLGAGAFPRTIDDAECVGDEFTFDDFQALYTWLLTESAAEISRVNAYQQPLLAELKELQDGQN